MSPVPTVESALMLVAVLAGMLGAVYGVSMGADWAWRRHVARRGCG